MKKKKKILCSFLIISLVITLYLALNSIYCNRPVSTFDNEKATPVEKRMDDVIQKHVKRTHFSGDVLVIKNDNVLFHEAYGYADRYFKKTKNNRDSRFLIGSVTKVFTGVAIMQLEEKKLLSFDDKLSKYYPDYPTFSDVTIHNLLNHTSGIKNYYKSALDFYPIYFYGHRDPIDIISQYKNKLLNFEPGMDYEYCNTNYIILTDIIEKVSGMDYETYIKKNIIDPLQLTDTGYEENPDNVEGLSTGYEINMLLPVKGMNLSNQYGAGGMYSTTLDLYTFFKSLDKKSMVEGNRKYEVIEHSFDAYAMTYYDEFNNLGEVYFHTGHLPGSMAAVYEFADQNATIVVLSNNTSVNREELVIDLYNAIEDNDF